MVIIKVHSPIENAEEEEKKINFKTGRRKMWRYVLSFFLVLWVVLFICLF